MENTRLIVIRILNIIGFLIGILLGLRIILRVFGANSSAPFVSWLYSVSEALIFPFRGIFNDINLQGNSVLDLSAIVAAIAYMLLISIIISIINSVTFPAIHEPHAHA